MTRLDTTRGGHALAASKRSSKVESTCRRGCACTTRSWWRARLRGCWAPRRRRQVQHKHPLHGRVAAVGQNDRATVAQQIPEELLAIERLPRSMHDRRSERRHRETGLRVQAEWILDRRALTAPAMHVDLETLRPRLSEAADAAHVLNMKYVGISSIAADARRTLDGYKRAADEFNEIGAKTETHGLRFTDHNHGYGLTEHDGRGQRRARSRAHSVAGEEIRSRTFLRRAGPRRQSGRGPAEELSILERFTLTSLFRRWLCRLHHFEVELAAALDEEHAVRGLVARRRMPVVPAGLHHVGTRTEAHLRFAFRRLDVRA
jgi:hypothetical protein